MHLKLKLVSVLVSAFIFIVIIDLVRRKRLREEFSLIWLMAGAIIVAISVWDKVLLFISNLTGIIAPTSIIFSFGIIFLMLINLQLSIKISQSRDEIKNLVQRIALYENQCRQLSEKMTKSGKESDDSPGENA